MAAKRVLKKYPNRRLYDTEASVYVTLEDVRKLVLAREPLQVLDSRTGADITRAVLLQIIAEQETEGHEPLLTNRVLEVLIRFYGEPGYGLMARFLEQSIATFLEQQNRYQRHMQQLLDRSPLRVMQQLAEQNATFWRGVFGAAPATQQSGPSDSQADASEFPLDADSPLDAGIELRGNSRTSVAETRDDDDPSTPKGG